jgi:hypothetical protein
MTEGERQEYKDYVDANDFIGILQAKARVVLGAIRVRLTVD